MVDFSRGYPLNQCGLYKVASPGMLARRLSTLGKKIHEEDLEKYANSSNNYLFRELKKPNGSSRKIEEPKLNLQFIHGRVHELLSRVELPDYVESVRRGHSYITNARRHIGEKELIKLDIESFYRSVKRVTIAKLFSELMLCAPDVSSYQLPRFSTDEPNLAFRLR